jgi:hypothetical protein
MTSILTNDTAPARMPTAADAMAARMYPEPATYEPEAPPNAAVAAMRAADATARCLYPPTLQFGAELRDLALATNSSGTEQGLAQQGVELAEVATDLGMTPSDLSNLATYVRQLQASPPTADAIKDTQRATAARLLEVYGADADAAFKDARALAQRDPRFAAYLDKTGLGDHPSLVLRLAELARSQRGRGLLK